MKNIFFLLLVTVCFFLKGFTQNRGFEISKSNDSLIIVNLIKKSNDFLVINLDSAMYCLRKAEKIERKKSNLALKSKIKASIGTVFSQKGLLDSAIVYEKKAIKIINENNLVEDKSGFLFNLGTFYLKKNDYEKSLNYFVKLIELYQRDKKYTQLTKVYNNIGIIYQLQKRYNKAINYHKKNIKVLKKIDSNSFLAPDFLNISGNYLNLKNNDSALYFAKLADKGFFKVKDYYGLALSGNILGVIYKEENRPFKAKEKFEHAIKLFNSIDSTLAIQPYIDLGDLFYEKFDSIKKSNKNYLKAKKLATSINDIVNLDLLYLKLGNTYFKSKNYRLSAKYLKKRIKLHDSLYSIERDEKINKLIAKFEDREKQQKINILNKENETKRQKLYLRNVIIVALLLLIFIIVALFYLLKQKQEQEIERKENQLQKYLFIINNNLEYEIDSKDFANKYNLTNREIEILILLKKGLSYSAIGDKLFISKNTVKYHLKNIYLKLDVKNKIEALNKINQ